LSWVGFLLLENAATVEEIDVRVVSVDFKDFGDKSAPGPAFDMNDDAHGVADVCLDGAKAKVSPETTMTTSDNPRGMVLVNASCRTFTAVSQGEAPCAQAGAASIRQRTDTQTA
jgi:hypothetical protein